MKEKALKFLVTGTFGTILDIGVLFFLVEISKFPVILANTFSFVGVTTIIFFIHKHWTFRNSDTGIVRQLVKYFAVGLVGLGISNLLLLLLLKMGIWYIYGKIVTVLVVFFWSLFANTVFTFKKH